jgi:hypothetical protein
MICNIKQLPARPVHSRQAMHKIIDSLLALQNLQFDARARTSALQAEMEKLRAKVPLPILGRFEQLVARGKKGVALARNGVCSGCHLRITDAKLVDLSAGADIQLCDNCGRYLYLPEGEVVGLSGARTLPSPAVKRTPRKRLTKSPDSTTIFSRTR